MTDWLADLQQPFCWVSISRNGPPAALAAVQSPVKVDRTGNRLWEGVHL